MDKLFVGHNPNPFPTLMGDKGQATVVTATDWGWDIIAQIARQIDVISLHKIPNIDSKIYPLKRISKKFNTEFFTNTICYMVAYALYKDYDEITIYGCDMYDKREYMWEKGGMEYWIGYGRGMGKIIRLAPGGNLCRTMTGRPFGTPEHDRIVVWQKEQSRLGYDPWQPKLYLGGENEG
jgi:hypothetical protein